MSDGYHGIVRAVIGIAAPPLDVRLGSALPEGNLYLFSCGCAADTGSLRMLLHELHLSCHRRHSRRSQKTLDRRAEPFRWSLDNRHV